MVIIAELVYTVKSIILHGRVISVMLVCQVTILKLVGDHMDMITIVYLVAFFVAWLLGIYGAYTIGTHLGRVCGYDAGYREALTYYYDTIEEDINGFRESISKGKE